MLFGVLAVGVACCALFDVRCLFFVVRRSSGVGRCLLICGCWLLFVVCCLMFFVC